MTYISLPFGLVRKQKKIKLDLPKSYGASQYMKRLPYIRNSIIDIVNNRSDIRKFLLATSDGRNIQEKINAVVADGKFNQDVVRRALDKKNKEVFESPIPLSVTFKDAKKFDIQIPVIGNLLSQLNANKIRYAKVKQLISEAKHQELQDISRKTLTEFLHNMSHQALNKYNDNVFT